MDKVIVLINRLKGEITRGSLELISCAKKLSDEVICIDVNSKDDILGYGVNKIYNLKMDYFNSSVLCDEIKKIVDMEKAKYVLSINSLNNSEICARLSVALGIGLVSNVRKINDDGSFLVEERDSDNFIKLKGSSPMICLVKEGSFSKMTKEKSDERIVEIFVSSDSGVKFLKSIKSSQKKDIHDAEIVVSVGLGLKEPKNLIIANELADELGAFLASSKPVADQLWISQENFVGNTGNKIRPRLYFAIGISGAINHIGGMKDSEIIIAVNNDENAIIREYCNYFVCEDLFEFVPRLTAEIKKL